MLFRIGSIVLILLVVCQIHKYGETRCEARTFVHPKTLGEVGEAGPAVCERKTETEPPAGGEFRKVSRSKKRSHEQRGDGPTTNAAWGVLSFDHFFGRTKK